MNLLTAFFLGLTKDRFEFFQVVFAFLNLLIFFPCLLILPALGGSRKREVLPLAVLFAASPVVMEAVTYAWTKAFAAFYIVLGIAFYLSGLRKNDSARVFAAFVALSAGLLVHYSAGPYLVFLALYYLMRMVRHRQWRLGGSIAVTCGLLMATWFGWSASVYGWKSTLAANKQVSLAREYEGSNLTKTAANLFDTVVPPWVRGDIPYWEPATGDPATRDSAFAFYETNLVFAMGVVGGPLALYLWIGAVRRRDRSGPERRFWTIMVPACSLLGVAVVGERSVLGTPQLTLLALEILGLSLLACHFLDLPRALRYLVIVGCAMDFWFGVLLQARVESLENTREQIVFKDAFVGGDESPKQLGITGAISQNTWANWATKHRYEIVARTLATAPQRYGNDASFQQAWPSMKTKLEDEQKDDARNWGGWKDRHRGVLSYMGDWTAGDFGRGTVAAAAAFCVVFAGLIAALTRSGIAARAAAPRLGLPRVPATHRRSDARLKARRDRRTSVRK